MNRLPARLPFNATRPPPRSRLATLLDFVIRHAGAIAVDPVHMLPLDPIFGRAVRHRPRPAYRRR